MSEPTSSTSSAGAVAHDVRGAVHVLTIDRESARNALNDAVIAGLVRGLDAAEADPDARVVVVTGRGEQAFCAGGDLKATREGSPFHFEPSDPEHVLIGLFRRMESCRLPIVARVNGHALAGGLGLLCACDLAVATNRARFGTPEVGVGIFPMMIFPFLARVLPPRKLTELTLTGEPVNADEALALGLVNHVVAPEELDAKTDWLVARLVDKSPTAMRLGKMGMRAMREMSVDQALEYAQLMLATMTLTEDAREGLTAFREKRKPTWTGK